MTDSAKSVHRDSSELRLRECELRLDRGEDHFQLVRDCLKANTDAIERLEASTKGVVEAYADVQAAARVGTALQKLVVFLLKFGGSLAAIGWALDRLLHYFKANPPNV